MKKIVSFSGGRTSAYLCHLMREKFGDEVDFVFMDTGFEHPKTYDFIKRVNEEFDLKLTCLRGDFSLPLGLGVGYKVVSIDDIRQDCKPFSEMMAKYGVPYIGGMFCTDRMKLKPFKKYCDDKYGKNNYETWLGIRCDEPGRIVGDVIYRKLKKAGVEDQDIMDIYIKRCFCTEFDYFGGMFTSNIVGYELDDVYSDIMSAYVSNNKKKMKFMGEICDFTKDDVKMWWGEQNFDLEIDEWLGNCIFCPKKSNLKLAAAQRDEPELYFEWLDMLYSGSVRHDDKTGHWSKMYRGEQSLENLIAMFDGSTGDQIKQRLRGARMTDTGSCSESCEAML